MHCSGLSVWLALKAGALYLANRTLEALEAIKEADGLVEKFEVRWWSAELQRLRGVFLTAIGAKEAEIEVSFRGAINTAKQQKANSLLARAEDEAKLIATRQHARSEPETWPRLVSIGGDP